MLAVAFDAVQRYCVGMVSTLPTRSRRDEYSAATREALLAAGREVFATVGFRDAALEAIARAARVTRGAVYHHFADKTVLFDAVVVALQTETAAVIAARARAERSLWRRLHVGIDAYLDECAKPDYRRIVAEEAPAVLGSARSREIAEATALRLVTATLDALRRRGEIVFDDIELLARMIEAMVCEVAKLLPDAPEPQSLRVRAHEMIERTLAAFSASAPAPKA
jgi:AcrR family transcriptional regulator